MFFQSYDVKCTATFFSGHSVCDCRDWRRQINMDCYCGHCCLITRMNNQAYIVSMLSIHVRVPRQMFGIAKKSSFDHSNSPHPVTVTQMLSANSSAARRRRTAYVLLRTFFPLLLLGLCRQSGGYTVVHLGALVLRRWVTQAPAGGCRANNVL